MAKPLAEQILQKINQAPELYHRLLLVVAPSGSGKTAALQEVQKRTGTPIININLELSRLMLELTERQRALRLPRLIHEILDKDNNDMVLLDNIEIIFDVSLKQDPLRLLQGVSRNKTLIAAWNGNIVGNFFTYASPDHHEYRRYEMGDFLVAGPSDSEHIRTE